MSTVVQDEARLGERRPRRPRGLRLNAGGWLAVAVGVVALVLAVRGRANSAPCAFVPLALPTLMVVFSRTERSRALRAVRALWWSLAPFPTGGKTPWAAALVFVALP